MTYITLLFVSFVIPLKELESSSPRIFNPVMLCVGSGDLLVLSDPAE